MASKEAYQTALQLTNEINDKIGKLAEFCREHDLQFGQDRYDLGTFELYDPELGLLNGKAEDDYGEPITEDMMYDRWVGSASCW